MIWVLAAGAFGGVLRGVLGIAKDLVTKKEVTINWVWFGITVMIAGILGIITASFFANDIRVAILGGYSGSDFVDGLMKLKLNELFKKKEEPEVAETKKYGNFGDLVKASEIEEKAKS